MGQRTKSKDDDREVKYHPGAKPYHVHRAAFTDDTATNPPIMAVDVAPTCGETPTGRPRATTSRKGT